MKIKIFYAALSVILICFITIAAFSANGDEETKSNKDIIKFSHAVHKDVTDCAGCHTKASESTSLKDRLLPEKSVCATCHDVNDDKQCSMCHIGENYQPLISKKSELFFNHKAHLGNPDVTCQSCHKGLSDVAYSVEAKEAHPSMAVCYTCHNTNSVASNECKTCHTSTVNLLPQNHKGVSFLKTHKFKSNEPNAECQMCHDNSFCESCHVGTTMITENNSSRNFVAPYSPHNFVDNTKQQNINRIHDLNFRFTHGIEAKGKSSECQTCHQTESFCAECHTTSGGDYAMEGMMPQSHRLPNFKTIGVGSGGGEHAILARRDIEACASCHDIQGGDATCILCHNDNDGIKGTNPKTHKAGFMKTGERGDWHTDRNSVCYSCHTDANARPGGIHGVGFCGYCHK